MAFVKTKLALVVLFMAIYIFIRPSYQLQYDIDEYKIPNSLNYKYFSITKNRRLLHGKKASVQVYDDLACFQFCARMKYSCFSVNFKKQAKNGLHLCELLKEDGDDTLRVFEPDEAFDHLSLLAPLPNSCAVYKSKLSRVFRIFPIPSRPINVYCDMETSGGGWTVIQKRIDGSVDFYRNWDEYKRGFGNKYGEYWLGLDNIHLMTSQRKYRLRVDMEDFKGNTRFAEYSLFHVSNEDDNYRLTIGQYSGTAGDSLTSWHNGQQFTTKDRDNDVKATNCAVEFSGAWWYSQCHQANLNGLYLAGASAAGKGINWFTWMGLRYSLKRVEMKIRPT